MREPVLQNSMPRCIKAMIYYGGTFAAALAVAYRCADPENATKLRCAFPEIFEKYDAMVNK